MDRLAALVLTLATAAFAGSITRFGAAPHLVSRVTETTRDHMQMSFAALPMGLEASLDLLPSPLPMLSLQMIQRGETIAWALVVALCVMMAVHVLRVLMAQWRAEQAAARRLERTAFLGARDVGPWAPQQIATLHARSTRVSEYGPLALALIAAAVWPWVTLQSPLVGFAAAALAMVAALTAVIRGQRDGIRIRHSVAVGMFAGWMTAVAMAAFVAVLSAQAGVSETLAAIAALILCGTIGTWVQWQLGRPIAYAMGLIWALVGIAAITMEHDPMVAMAAILSIAALAISVVRSAT